MSSSSSTVLVAGSALAAAIGIGYLVFGGSNSEKNKEDSYEVLDIDDDGGGDDDKYFQDVHEYDQGEMISPDDIIGIFDKLFLEIQAIFAQLMQQVQQIQMAGQMIPEQQLRQLIRGELERALTVKQKIIIDEQYNIDIDCCEEATWEFILKDKNADVIKSVERFQKFWENATGEPVTGWYPGKSVLDDVEILSPTDTVMAAEIYFESLTNCMRNLVNRYKFEGKNLEDTAVQQQLNLEFTTKVSDAGEDALREHNITMNQFEASIKAHSSNPTVGGALAMLQKRQHAEMMNMS
jgi:hypothetical protein